MQKESRLQAVVFDLDGTLVDTAPDLAAALNKCLTEHGHAPFAVSDMRHLVGHGAAALLEKGFGIREGKPLSKPRLESLRQSFLTFYARDIAAHSKPFPGARSAISQLRNAGIVCAICTNKPEAMARQLLQALGWTEPFSVIIGGDSLAFKKPDPRHLGAVLHALGCPKEDAIFVGDSEVDFETAKALNIECLMVPFGYATGQVRALDGVNILEHFDDLPARVTRRSASTR